jgi:protein O-mannosyl-transferase
MPESSLRGKLHNHSTILIILFLLALTVIVYSKALDNDFVNLDDPSYVTENPHVITGLTLDNVQWAFTSIEQSNWHPLTWISHMTDAQIFGINPKGHHLTSLLLHAANAALLFLILSELTSAQWRSAFVAALFAVHPLHVESVAWISERKDVLSTLFFLITILCYSRYVTRPGPWRYAAVLAAFASGLMAKPMLVTLPCVLLLLDYWPLARYPAKASLSRLAAEKAPLFMLSVMSGALTLYAQKMGGAVASMAILPLGARVANALLSYVAYIWKTLWPTRLVALYPMSGQLPLWQVAGAALLLGAISAAVFWKGRRMPFLPVGWLWFLGTLVPVIGLVQVGGQAMADRYTYIPHIGLFILIVWGAAEAAGQRHWSPAISGAAMAAVIAALTALTWMQISYWRNGIELYGHTLRFTERNALAHYHMGVALTERGRTTEAISHYTQALEIAPDYASAHFGLACALMQQRLPEQAVAEYEKAARLDAGDARVLFNLGNVLVELGRYNDAITRYREALQITPLDENIHNKLGTALAKQGRVDEALAQFSEALRINPQNEFARINMRSFDGNKGK